MAKSVPINKLANEFGFLVEELAKLDESERELFLSVFVKAKDVFLSTVEENGKAALLLAIPEGANTYTATKLTDEETAKVAELEDAIKTAKAEAKAAEENEAQKVFKANMAALAKCKDGVSLVALSTKQNTALATKQATARKPHEEKATEKATEKVDLESKRTDAAKVTFTEKLSGSTRTVHKVLTQKFTGIWRAKGTATRGETVYHVERKALYHAGIQQDTLTFLGNIAIDSATGLQRAHNALTDDENQKIAVPYSSKPEDQKAAFLVVKPLLEGKLKDLDEYGWKDVGGSALCKHVTFNPKDGNKYDLDAQVWQSKLASVPEEIVVQLELTKPA